jgi:hypothetical protein
MRQSWNYHCWGNRERQLTLCGLHIKGVPVTTAGNFVTLEGVQKVVDDKKLYGKCPTCETHPDLTMKLLEELP